MVSAERSGGQWTVRLRDVDTGEEFTTTARTIVNAAGPFVDEVNQQWGLTTEHRIVYSKGIHLVVPRLTTTEHHKVLAFFDDSQRLFYVIPMGRRSVIGTTDTRVDTPFTEVTDDDIDFLLDQINARMDLTTHRSAAATSSPNAPGCARWSSSAAAATTATSTGPSSAGSTRSRATEPAAWSRCSAANSPTASTWARRSPTRSNVSGVPLEPDLHNWYGEPAAATRDEFHRQARLMQLDRYRTKAGTEPLTDRLWRRYGRRAFAMLEAIREDPRMAEDIMGSADYIRVELHAAARTEMVTKLEDFMRRRSKIDLVVHDDDIRDSAGLAEVAEILFGDDAERRLAEYFGGADEIPSAVRAGLGRLGVD
jgi:glycerol-3-phosphate dehydrogenase